MATRPVHERASRDGSVVWLHNTADGAWSMRWKPRDADRRQLDRTNAHRQQLPRRGLRGVARAVQYGCRVVVRDSSLAVSTVIIFLLFPTAISNDYQLARNATDWPPTKVRNYRLISRTSYRAKRNSCSHLIREFTPTYSRGLVYVYVKRVPSISAKRKMYCWRNLDQTRIKGLISNTKYI